MSHLAQLLFALSALILAGVTGAVSWRVAKGRFYREGRRDGWNDAVDRLSPPRIPMPPTLVRGRKS